MSEPENPQVPNPDPLQQQSSENFWMPPAGGPPAVPEQGQQSVPIPPAQPPTYPAQPPSYPAQPGYPVPPAANPAQPGAYPVQPGAYPAAGPAVPGQPPGVPGYPTAQYPISQPADQPGQLAPTGEKVGRGLLFGSLGVIAGIALTVAIWQVGFVASITSFAMAAAAVWLYAKGAGSPPRKGVIPLVALVVVGVLISIPACIVSDGVAGVQEAFPGTSLGESIEYTIALIQSEPSVLSDYTFSIFMMVAFAALGVFSTLRGVARNG